MLLAVLYIFSMCSACIVINELQLKINQALYSCENIITYSELELHLVRYKIITLPLECHKLKIKLANVHKQTGI